MQQQQQQQQQQQDDEKSVSSPDEIDPETWAMIYKHALKETDDTSSFVKTVKKGEKKEDLAKQLEKEKKDDKDKLTRTQEFYKRVEEIERKKEVEEKERIDREKIEDQERIQKIKDDANIARDTNMINMKQAKAILEDDCNEIKDRRVCDKNKDCYYNYKERKCRADKKSLGNIQEEFLKNLSEITVVKEARIISAEDNVKHLIQKRESLYDKCKEYNYKNEDCNNERECIYEDPYCKVKQSLLNPINRDLVKNYNALNNLDIDTRSEEFQAKIQGYEKEEPKKEEVVDVEKEKINVDDKEQFPSL